MRPMWRAALVSGAIGGLVGCAQVPMGDAQQDAAAKRFQRPSGDKAGLYIYRNETFGTAIRMDVAVDGQPWGQTAAKTYFYKELSPGRHTVKSEAENTDTLEVDLQPGTLAYVWQEVKLGVLMARVKLSQVSEAMGKKGVLESQMAALPGSPAALATANSQANSQRKAGRESTALALPGSQGAATAGSPAAVMSSPVVASPVTLDKRPDAVPASFRKPDNALPLRAEDLVGHSWTYPHPRDPARYGDIVLRFSAQGMTAQNAVSRASGTWEVGDDFLCFNADHGWGATCLIRVRVNDQVQLRFARGQTVPLIEN